jgi:transcriptional regulator with XRE-family HTH domain
MDENAPQEIMPLFEQVDVLFQYGKTYHMVVTYNAIARETGETATNVHKIHRGDNANPGINTLRSLAGYFGVGLGYFDCQTDEECWSYLEQKAQHHAPVDANNLQQPSLRSEDISPEVLDALESMIQFIRRREGWD